MSTILTLGKLNPIQCHFPHKSPYVQQLESMNKLVDVLENKQNVLLESPTGTGKTKTILCSVLPWCMKNNKKLLVVTRTHDQVEQFIRSIHETNYTPKVCVLASKSRTCIHPDKNSFPNPEDGCRESIQCKNCSSYTHIKKLIPKNSTIDDIEVPIEPSNSIFDLEDIVKKSSEKDLCPYFVTKTMVSKSDIICCPYNYLVDPAIFKQTNIKLEDCVVVIDEAHNVENLSRTVIHFEETLGVSFKKMINDLSHWMTDKIIGKIATFFHLFLTNFSTFVNSLEIEPKKFRKKTDDSPDEYQIEKDMLVKFLKEALKISNEKYMSEFDENVEHLNNFIMEHEKALNRKGAANNNPFSKKKRFNTNILKWIQSLQKTMSFMKMNKYSNLRDFKYVVRQPPIRKHMKKESNNRSIHIWNMNSSLGFLHIKEMVRSLIFLSGTLHPFESIESEMDLKFEVKMRLDHVIDMHKQMKAIAVSTYNGEKMDSKMGNRQNQKYFDQLFNLIFDICSNTKEGVIVFFPSFSFMKLCFDNWKYDRNVDKLKNIKSLFVETQGAHHNDFIKMLKEYRSVCKTKRGACMFGVQRGKLSEGIDLNDECSRAVVAIGIPYPNMKEKEISLKMKYNDEKHKKYSEYLSGFDYVKKEAFRSLNQSLGRCIRHINDYGMIYLVDCRFSDRNNKNCISPWLGSHVSFNNHATVSFVRKECDKFFSMNKESEKEHIEIAYENESIENDRPSKKIKI